MLAKFGALLEPSQTPAKSQTLEELGQRVSARRSLIKDRTATKNHRHTLQSTLLKRQANQRLKQIEGHIKVIDNRCQKLIQQDDRWTKRYVILNSIPGIGALTAIIMLSECLNSA